MWFLYGEGLKGIKYEGEWGRKTPILFFIRTRCKIWALSDNYTDWYNQHSLCMDSRDDGLMPGVVPAEEVTLEFFMKECGKVYQLTDRETEIFTYIIDGIDNHYNRPLWGAYISAARKFGVSRDYIKEVIQSCQSKIRRLHADTGVPVEIWGHYFEKVQELNQH
jgi:hypothetical protein